VIVLYDSDCGFCRWTIAWALKRDRNHVLGVAPIQSSTGAELLADLDPAERLESAHAVHDDGRRESGGAAVRTVLEVLPSARPLAWLAGLSPRLTEAVYRLVADHRSAVSRLVPARAKRRADALLASGGRGLVPSR
jgi:predicted DCC family thiol-disulfide oxidoreductase YuxK